MEWQDISTAPKDVKIMVCQSDNGIIATARWDSRNEHWSTGGGCMNFIAGVTHWMPLPKPPVKEG